MTAATSHEYLPSPRPGRSLESIASSAQSTRTGRTLQSVRPDLSPCLYIADIGDNSLSRDFVVVYRVREPDLTREDTTLQTAQVEPFQFRYPDGKYNAEALVVDPESGRMYVITKSDSTGCEVFRSPVPLKLGEPMTLERVVSDSQGLFAQWRRVTGAATAPDGSRVVIRNYFSAFELHRAPGKDFESIFSATPAPINMPSNNRAKQSHTRAMEKPWLLRVREGRRRSTCSDGGE